MSTIPLADGPIDPGDLLVLLQSLEPEKAEQAAEEESVPAAAPTAAVAKVHSPAPSPGDWNIALADLGDLCGLQGLEEPATRALAALAANVHVMLSGNTVTLPYRRRSKDGKFRRVRLQVGSAVVEDRDADVIVVPAWWRIVGSMNDADKASLKRLSMAFVRRFAFIPIDLPAPGVYEAMIRAAIDKTGAAKVSAGDMAGLTKVLIELFSTTDGGLGGVGLPLGPAFPLSVIRHADSEWRLDPARSFVSVLSSAMELYVMPQLQGGPDLHDKVADLFRPLLATRHDEFVRHLAVWTGYVPG